MPTLHKVCRVGELKDGECGTLCVERKTIAVFRVGDEYFAIDNMCPHMGAELSGGFVEDGVVTCPWHYWRFRLADGAWADNPRIKIGSYPVRIVNDEIHVEIPDAASQ
jgi:nitrite reductase (NADH) small subunit/3-phenylpropionate/trans-cinnamate dioxygenase ferredoxin subunit